MDKGLWWVGQAQEKMGFRVLGSLFRVRANWLEWALPGKQLAQLVKPIKMVAHRVGSLGLSSEEDELETWAWAKRDMESSKKRKRAKRRHRAPNENPKLSSKEETTPTAETVNENEEENPKASKLRKSRGLVSNSSSFLAKVMNTVVLMFYTSL